VILDTDIREHLIATIAFDQAHAADDSRGLQDDFMFDGKIRIAIQRAMDPGTNLPSSPMILIQVNEVSV
jgi:hypothetical protein